eukprot:CAMPEP_0203748978 /NCGR_PEP_ID=MMETSP0098-20131031/3699_1 /ASSEMBLY_ACC=CAM_ASM_000208 /TAXON_ID=96639 /ORGANISM=" , Strain NY0313808BC1" /LENGTH=542 /DNA_ID=CAMNT_0050637905 /DNA_START=297 /DNA_END=1925 /DNA_ORIENTATION=-
MAQAYPVEYAENIQDPFEAPLEAAKETFNDWQRGMETTIQNVLDVALAPVEETTKMDFSAAATWAATTVPPAEAYTLPPLTYSSDEFYEFEKKTVFSKSWVCIGMSEAVRQPGDTLVADVGGQPIFAVRDKKGELNGFLNVCRHRGSKLVTKNGRNPVISCPYHRWGYALDGRLLATPMWDTVEGGDRIDKETGERKAPKVRKRKGQVTKETMTMEQARDEVEKAEQNAIRSQVDVKACNQMQGIAAAYDTDHIVGFDKKDFSLFKVRVDTWGPFTFATLASEDEVPSLEEYLGDAASSLANYPLDELVNVREKTYESKANWKLLSENFMEYYHLPSVHPALCEVSTVDNHHRAQGPGMYVGFVTNPLTNGGTPIDPNVLPSFPGLKGEEVETGVFHQLFPNAFYFLLPSHIFTVILKPTSAGVTIEQANLLVHPSLLEDAKVKEETAVLNKKLDDMMAFYDMTNLEDIHICELVQDGVRATAYQGGRVSYRFEETIHRFQNMLVDHLVGHAGRVPKGDEAIAYYLGGKEGVDASSQLQRGE